MKRHLLILSSLILSSVSYSQFTQSNEPAIGNDVFMYQCDSNAVTYDATTGTGVTWDYSALLGLPGQDQTISVGDATMHANASEFPTSVKVVGASGNFVTFFNSTATERMSQGFAFNEATFGEVIAKFDVDEAKLFNYPMAVGDNFEDDFAGSLSFDFSGQPLNPTTTGTSYVTVDGSGTLMLGQSTTLANVMRYKSIDSIFFNVSLVGDMEVVRTSYDYYQLSSSNLPKFTIMNIKIQNLGATTPLVEQNVVLSAVEPNDFVGLNDLSADNINVYPNPTAGEITISGLTTSETVSVIDYTGRNLKTFNNVANGQVLNLSDLNAGSYILKVGAAIKNISIK
ncbi:MAG: T9SS type A sorting domain-containing protein [Bacteroidota bacterium]